MAPNSPPLSAPNAETNASQLGAVGNLRGLFVHAIAVIWRLLDHPVPLFVLSVLALATASAGLILPQVSNRLIEESAAMSRWILTASGEYGWFGPALRNLGLFNVLHSALLRLLLAAIGMILLLQCAKLAGQAFLFYRLQRQVRSSVTGFNHPLTLRRYTSLFRHRMTIVGHFDTCEIKLVERMMHNFERTTRYSVPLHVDFSGDDHSVLATSYKTSSVRGESESRSNGSALTAANPRQDHDEGEISELRIVGINAALSAFTRPLLPAGLLLALFALWLIVTFGWNMSTPLMVPGDSYTSIHNVIVDYQVPPTTSQDGDLVAPLVTVARGPATVQSIITTFGSAYLDEISLQTVPASPGLVVRTDDGTQRLSRPGQTTLVEAIGLAFPVDGSEESVLIPDALTGLRIVRQQNRSGEQTDSNALSTNTFVIETYYSSIVQPVEKFEFNESTTVPIVTGSTSVHLRFQTAPAIFVKARYVPGTWLFWPAAVLAIIGFVGTVRRPEFLVVQAHAWSPTHTLLILQSNFGQTIHTIMAAMDGNPGSDQNSDH